MLTFYFAHYYYYLITQTIFRTIKYLLPKYISFNVKHNFRLWISFSHGLKFILRSLMFWTPKLGMKYMKNFVFTTFLKYECLFYCSPRIQGHLKPVCLSSVKLKCQFPVMLENVIWIISSVVIVMNHYVYRV